MKTLSNREAKLVMASKKKEQEESIQGINLSDIKSIDKLSEGMFIIEMKDGLTTELSLDDGEADTIDHHLNRQLLSNDASLTDGTPSDIKIELPEFNRNALERNLGSWMEVTFVNSDISGYWATEDDISYYMQAGYTYATPNMIKFYKSTFSGRNPGEGESPEGHICRNGHTLLVCRQETSEQLKKFHYNKRQKPEDRKFHLSKEKMATLGI